ncbi:hypothetical protein BKA66DRAFT_576078 [Pyrenochaeta sp. MPI-SDFR-AT-0127]|nr:hypothetical protein BKA66DRAFT_576078 [Pyrenochaeta sp. MPI-SDFR-AT-0127]
MTKTSCLVSLLFLFLSALVTCDDIETPQGNISIAILQQLQSTHGVAINQKEQENLFLTLPLVAPNDTDLVAVGNISTANAAPLQSRGEDFAPGHHDKRQGTRCSHQLRFEGDDACRGYENMPGYVACRQPCQFTRDFFMSITARKPEVDECVFYTSGLSNTAVDFVRRHNAIGGRSRLTTIWEIWGDRWMPQLTDQRWDNDMRCIVQVNVWPGRRNTVRQQYFERMSDTMAYMCGGKAAIMDRNIRRGRTGRVKQSSIWNQVEFPRLKMSGADKWTDTTGRNRVITRVDAIGENIQTIPDTLIWWRSWWYRGGPDWPNEFTKPFKKRALDGNETDSETFIENEAIEKRDVGDTSIFDEGGALEVNW